MNRSYVATRYIRRRGREWREGDEVLPALTDPDWRRRLLQAGAVRAVPGPTFPEPAAHTVDQVEGIIAEIDDTSTLRAMLSAEREGRNRVRAVALLDRRIKDLESEATETPDDDEAEEPEAPVASSDEDEA